MKTLALRAVLMGTLALAVGSDVVAADTPAPLTAKELFGLPNLRAPRLSPDGTKIAFLFPHENRLALGVFDRATKESRMIVRGADESIFRFFWKGNDRIVFAADFQGNESFFIGTTDLAGKKIVRIVETQPGEFLQASAGGIVDPLHNDPERIVVNGYLRPPPERPGDTSAIDMPISVDFVVAKVNVANRGISPLFTYQPIERTRELHVDNAGVVRIRAREEHGTELVWEHRLADDKPWREIARHPLHGYAETWSPQFFAADNTTLWLISREEHDRGALYAYNTRTLERGPALFVPPEGEIEDIHTTPDHAKLLGVSYESERRHDHWFDDARAQLQARLESTFKGCDVRIASESDDGSVRLVWVGYDREPGTYFVLDAKAGSLAQFRRTRDIDPARLRPMEPVAFKARDGLELHGYLTRPAGAEGQCTPLVVHPHGGPFGIRDSWGFDAEVQFLAGRGYAVLQVNYRGSGGYGREFINKGRQQWGRAMQDDLSDAVQWAVAQGLADPARVAIFGASYGGYASLAGATLTPELYCCAVNYVGPSDLNITFKNRGDDAWVRDSDFSYQREWVGPTADYRAATSPVNFVERIRVPTLHAYGEKDPRVKIDHWTRLEPQLKKFGKIYETIEQKQQGHGFRDEKASVGFYDRLDTFFAKYLAPGGGAKAGESKAVEMPAKK